MTFETSARIINERSYYFGDEMKNFAVSALAGRWSARARTGGAAWVMASALLALPLSSQAAEAGGVRFPDKLSVAGTPLVLNGAGVRYKAVFKVYAAALYAPEKSVVADELIGTQAPKRLSITMLRDIESDELGKMFSRGMEDNMDRVAFSRLVPGVLRLSQLFSDHKKLAAGDSFTVDWVPGTGTVVTIKGEAPNTMSREPEFFQALLRIWLGNKPADWKLKDALLGKSTSS